MDATPAEVLQLARELMDAHGLSEWTAELMDRRRFHGLCNSREKKIYLRRKDVFHRSSAFVKDTILHEIAHALTPNDYHHGKEWRDTAYRIGVRDPGYGRYNLNASARLAPKPTDFAKKLALAETNIKRISTRIKRLNTAMKKWQRRAKLYRTRLASA